MRIDPAIPSFSQKRESRNKDNYLDSCLCRKDAATHAIQTLPNGSVLVDYGPMRMFISVYEDGKSLVTLAQEGAYLAIRVLEDLAKFLPVIKEKAQGLEVEKKFPDVVRRMVEATQSMEESDLTPLAAVAGAASDVVADFIFDQGGSKIIVDNGGDIAIRLRDDEVAKVGVKTDIHSTRPSYVISIDSTMGIGGVTTSGLGGRSFTKGIASAATVLSKSAALADAAATVIGNFTNVDDPSIRRSLAERIYPDTDIAGAWVTTEVGGLSPEKIEEALKHGLSKAYSICKRKLIKGALIAVKDQVVWTDSLNSVLTRI
jgi:ApbE superfamily uncharacterized protein (UPF0280 family)